MPLATINRFAAPILGGYVFAYGFVALATLAGYGVGMDFFVAQSLAWMTGLAVFLAAMLWGFAPRRPIVVWGVLAGGGLCMSLAALGLSRALGA